jgi:hypothetical protein
MGVVIQFRPRPAPATVSPVKRWREMSDDERDIALAFAECPELRHNDFAAAMFNVAVDGDEITDRQGSAILAVARRYGIIPPVTYSAADIPTLRAEIAQMTDEDWADRRGILERAVRLLELGVDRVERHRRGLLCDGLLFVGPKAWRNVAGGKWHRYEDLAELIAPKTWPAAPISNP